MSHDENAGARGVMHPLLQLTAKRTPPLLPEIALHLAHGEVWLDPERLASEHGASMPYWSVAWAGGIALARFLLDHRAHVAGKRVVDFGSGSGLVAIAAALAGAASVTAVDIDPLAREAIAWNAAANGVGVDVAATTPPACDVVLAADVLYDRDEGEVIERWLRTLAVPVLLADSRRPWSPTAGLRELACYHVVTSDRFDDDTLNRARVYELC